MDDNKDSKTVAKGWTVKNFLIGGILLVFGCLLYMADLALGILYGGDSSRSIPLQLNILLLIMAWVAILAIPIGVSGFWIIIPAFQRWWGTKKQWLVWVFLIIGIGIAPLLLFFYSLLVLHG